MKKIREIFIYILAIIGLVFVLYSIIGYRLTLKDNLVIHWSSLSTITQVLMAIATFIAVYVALEPSRVGIVLHFYMKYNTYADLSLANSKPKLFITNPSNKTIIIHKIGIFSEKLELAYINLLSDDSYRPQIESVNQVDFSKVQPIIINPNQTFEVAFSVMGLEHVFGHCIDAPNNNDTDNLIQIEVTDMKGKKSVLKTKITFGEYYENLISIIEDKSNEKR